METTISRDGTRIAFERRGNGRPVILVGGALQGRAAHRPLAEELARALTVINYDRRGRGDSGDTPPYAVAREVEDLAALITVATETTETTGATGTGGTVSVYGHSSGAALALRAAAHKLPIDRLVLHEPPFGSGSEAERRAEQAEAEEIAALLAQGRRSEALRSFFAGTGMPAEMADHLSHDPAMLANAATLPYDPYEVMHESGRGGRTPTEQASGVTVPALVLVGGNSPEWMLGAGRQVAAALPAGELRILAGQEHVVPPDVLAPVLAEFIGGRG